MEFDRYFFENRFGARFPSSANGFGQAYRFGRRVSVDNSNRADSFTVIPVSPLVSVRIRI